MAKQFVIDGIKYMENDGEFYVFNKDNNKFPYCFCACNWNTVYENQKTTQELKSYLKILQREQKLNRIVK